MANVGKCLSCDGPATHLKPDEDNSNYADPTCSDCCGGCSDSDCDANDWGTQSDNEAAARAVGDTIPVPHDRAQEPSRRMVAVGKLGNWGPWTDSPRGENREVRLSGSLSYDRDFFHKGEDPSMDGTYAEPVVHSDYIDFRDKATGDYRGRTILADPWGDDASAARAARDAEED